MTYSLGEDIFKKLTIVDENEAVVDISDVSWEIYVGLFLENSDNYNDPAELQLTVGSGVTKTNALVGEAEIHITDVQTQNWQPGTRYIWVKAKNPTGYEWDIIRGEAMVFEHSPMKDI